MPTVRRAAPVLLTLLLLATAAAPGLARPATAAPATAAPAADDRFRPAAAGGVKDEYVVVLAGVTPGKPDEVDAAAKALLTDYPGELRRAYHHALAGFAVTMAEDVARALAKDKRIRFVEQVGVMWYLGEQRVETWGLGAVDQRGGIDPVYRWGTDGTGVHAYVVDSGIRSTHTEFAGRVSGDVSFVPDDIDRWGTEDCNGHGTAMASVIGGRVHGVAKNARLHTVRIGGCVSGTTDAYLEAADWLAAHAARPAVVNLSAQALASEAVDAATQALLDRGITVVGAAGNSEDDACGFSPGRLPGVITVGASGPFAERWSDPDRGTGSSFGRCVDLFAPGDAIGAAGNSSDTADIQTTGTSVATAFVTGGAARYLQTFPDATPAMVKAALLDDGTRDRVTDPRGTQNVLLYLDPDGPGNDGVGGARGDVDGDGRVDVVTFVRGEPGDVWVARSTGAEFRAGEKWHDDFAGGHQLPLLGDVDGDGDDDLISFTRGTSADVFVARSTRSSFGPVEKWHDYAAPLNRTPVVGDFDGDGRDDIAELTRGGSGDVLVALSEGTRFAFPTKLWVERFARGSAVPLVGDVTCDGRDDLVAFDRGRLGTVTVAVSLGNAFATPTVWRTGFATGGRVPAVADFDGDGCADIAEFTRGASGQVRVALSQPGPAPYTWRSFGEPTTWHTAFAHGAQVPGAADVTGDGRADILAFTRGDAADVYVAPATTGGSFHHARKWSDWFAFGLETPMPAVRW